MRRPISKHLDSEYHHAAEQRERTGLIRLLTAVLSVLLFFDAGMLPVMAAETSNERQVVKVGYYYDSDYYYKNDQGDYCGYDAEYLYELSKYTDWKYQYVDFDNFEDALNALETGQVDVMPALFYTEERAESLLLSDRDMGSIYVTVVVPPSNTSIAYDDVKALEGKKVGILADSVDGLRYREWTAEQGLNTEIVEMDSTEELLSALDKGELSAVAISYLGTNSKYRIIKEFSPMKMYFGMPKDHTALMSQLNTALDDITIETPDFASNLYRRYYIANQKQTPVFTEEEKKYIAANQNFTVGIMDNDAPFSYTQKDGTLAGAMIDYFNKIAQLSGMNITFKGYDTIQDILTALNAGEIDIAGSLVYDAVGASGENIYLTNSYIDLALTEVTLQGTDQITNIAVPKYLKSVVSTGLESDDTTLVYFDNVSECVDALHSGKADAAVINTYCANYFMNNARSGTYNITALNGFSYSATAGVSESDDKVLLSILNRCIRYSSATTMNELLTEYTQGTSNSLGSILNRVPVVWVMTFAMIMCCFVIVLIILFFMVRRRQREQLAMSARQSEIDRKTLEVASKEKTTKEKNDFFSNISHDMRTPLNAVIGFMRMSKKPGISEEERNTYVDKAILFGKLLLDLVDDTLVVSRAANGKLILHPEPVSSRELFESVITPIRQEAEKKNITFTVDDSTTMDCTVMADRLNVQKIFLNLLSNAVKYTPEGGHVNLMIHNEPSENNGIQLLMIIDDDGIGMSEDFMKHMYEPFVQEQRSGHAAMGTGLGLSIVKQLVDLMGGSIDVSSKEAEGTTFTVQLHFEKADPVKASLEALPEEIIDMNGKNILICEDNSLNSEIAAAMLKDQGMTSEVAENGQIGLQMFNDSAEGYYDAVLMDIRMPVMGGIEATEAIRALDRADAKSVPIIAMSADAFADDIERCMQAGMNGHIAKPVDPQILYRTLSREMSRNDKN